MNTVSASPSPKNQRQLDEAATRSQMSELQQNRRWSSQAIDGVRESLYRINHEKQCMNLVISEIPESPRENVSTIIIQLASKPIPSLALDQRKRLL